jgi:hypothetical protein
MPGFSFPAWRAQPKAAQATQKMPLKKKGKGKSWPHRLRESPLTEQQLTEISPLPLSFFPPPTEDATSAVEVPLPPPTFPCGSCSAFLNLRGARNRHCRKNPPTSPHPATRHCIVRQGGPRRSHAPFHPRKLPATKPEGLKSGLRLGIGKSIRPVRKNAFRWCWAFGGDRT